MFPPQPPSKPSRASSILFEPYVVKSGRVSAKTLVKHGFSKLKHFSRRLVGGAADKSIAGRGTAISNGIPISPTDLHEACIAAATASLSNSDLSINSLFEPLDDCAAAPSSGHGHASIKEIGQSHSPPVDYDLMGTFVRSSQLGSGTGTAEARVDNDFSVKREKEKENEEIEIEVEKIEKIDNFFHCEKSRSNSLQACLQGTTPDTHLDPEIGATDSSSSMSKTNDPSLVLSPQSTPSDLIDSSGGLTTPATEQSAPSVPSASPGSCKVPEKLLNPAPEKLLNHASPPESQPIALQYTEKPDLDLDSENDESDEEQLNPGYRHWKRQRREWLKGSENVIRKPSILEHVPESKYPQLYKVLVEEKRQLKQPINLEDAIKVIRAGWIQNGTWPTEVVD